jgi:hypothetical protein
VAARPERAAGTGSLVEIRMKRRALKVGLLVCSGALLLQAGCATIAVQLLLRNVISQVISGALSTLIQNANAAGG